MHSPNIALILAGGNGCRMHGEKPKQFLEVNGKPVIAYTLQAFDAHSGIDCLAVVCMPEWQAWVKALATQLGLQKPLHLFDAGATSHDSIRNGIRGLVDKGFDAHSVVLVHDAVRPLVSARIISENIATCCDRGNAVTVVRGCESYLYSEDGISSSACYRRELMYRVQTPHTFRLADIAEAYDAAGQQQRVAQSLYVLMAELGKAPFFFVKGERRNFKLTYHEDLELLKFYLATPPEQEEPEL